MIGVALVPALYNLSFLGSMWDPYGRVEDLPIAVVNHDRAAKLNQKDLHIGKDMVDKMSKNKDLDYHFVSEKKAENGLRDGDYYMVVTLPKDLSKKATTLLENNPEKLVIQYQTSRGHGMVASKMSEAAMAKLKSSVSDNISRTYTTSVFQSMSNLQTGLEDASTGSGQLAQGANSAKVGSQEITRNLGSLANGSQTLNQGVNQLNSGLVTYTGGVSQLNNGISKFSSQLPLYLDAISQLSNGAGQLTAGLNKLASETTMSQEETQGVQALQVGLPQLNNAIQELNNAVSGLSVPNTADLMEALTGISNLAQGIIDSEASSTSSKLASLQATSTYKSLTPEQQAELSQAISATPSNATAGAQRILAITTVLKTKLANLPNNSNVSQLQASVNKIANLSNQALPQASAALVKLSAGVKSVNSGVTNQLLPGSYKISSALASLNSKNQEILTGLTAISSGSKRLNANSNALLDGTQKLATGTNDLSQGAIQLTNGSAKLTDGLTTMSSGLSTLQMSLAEASHKLNLVSVKEKNAKAVASPVALSEKDNDSVKTNGIGMAPYMIAVSLMVVALSTNVIFATSLSGRPVKNRWDWAKQKFIINGFISTLSSLILYGAIQFLGFEANYELKTLTFIILSGWTLMALVTALVGWDDRYGSFASLAMLLLQVGSSGGSYPIELSGRFFQTLHPYLPMSYIVSGLRETISLTGHIGLEVNILTGFLVGFLVLALIIYRPKNSQ